MIDAKNIITLGPPETPIYDVIVTNVVNAAQGGYELRYRPVRMVMYVREGQHYPWETETIVVGKRYSFKDRSIPGLDFYRPEEEHGNTKQGRCECGNSSCHLNPCVSLDLRPSKNRKNPLVYRQGVLLSNPRYMEPDAIMLTR